MEQRLLKTGEVAAMLACSTYTVRRLAAEGAIPVVRFGEHGHLRFSPEDVDGVFARRYSRKETDALAAP